MSVSPFARSPAVQTRSYPRSNWFYAKKNLIAEINTEEVYIERCYGPDLSQDPLINDMRPVAAGDGSLSFSVMIPRSRASGRPRIGTALSSFPRKLVTPLLGAIANPIPARTKPSMVANCETVTTWFKVNPTDEAAPSMTRLVLESLGKETSGTSFKSDKDKVFLFANS